MASSKISSSVSDGAVVTTLSPLALRISAVMSSGAKDSSLSRNSSRSAFSSLKESSSSFATITGALTEMLAFRKQLTIVVLLSSIQAYTSDYKAFNTVFLGSG